MHNTKKCCDCKEQKNDGDFYKGQKRCKVCTKERNRVFREKNPDYFKAGGRGYTYGSLENKTAFNKNRYQKHRDSFLNRKDEWSRSVRGRLYDLLEAARHRSKKNGREIDIDLEWLMEQFKFQEGKCAATGITLTLERNPQGKRFYIPTSPSIDRIDSNLGYTKGNCRLVCVAFNIALNKFGEDFFEKMCRAYLEKKVGTSMSPS